MSGLDMPDSVGSEARSDDDDRKKLDGLMRFAHGVLTARDKVQMSMATGLGVYHEDDIFELPGVHFNEADGAWLRIERLRESKPQAPDDYIMEFMSSNGADPARRPEIRPAISKEVPIELASDLAEAGLLRPENLRTVTERGVELTSRVQVTLLAEDCPEMTRNFETWRDEVWSDWARTEKPIRRSITLYQSLFKLHAAIHAAENLPPEVVWGIGVGRWKIETEVIDMPLIEQLVDIEIEDKGPIVIRPRDLPPSLSLKPYIHVEISGAAKLQNHLKGTLEKILMGEDEFSPFNPSGWEHILSIAAAQLSSSAVHTTRESIESGAAIQPISDQLSVTSSWVIYGRPRSNDARSQDIEALRRALAASESSVPASIKGFAAPEPDKPEDATDRFGLSSNLLTTSEATNDWEQSSARNAATTSPPQPPSADEVRAYFFPLPFNDEQSKIIDLLDAPENDVVTVTGPPGTGKTHTIANLISHFMAIGKRVLVTARTPEAIAAVREKLPASLRSLVIASVGTDRESAQQLRDAMRELSDEVIGLNMRDADERRRRLESEIVACDSEAQSADRQLAEIARENLAALTWNGESYSAMDLIHELDRHTEKHGWFRDRPRSEPPSQLLDALNRLKKALPGVAPDIIYCGVALPDLVELPTTSDLINAHEHELAWRQREVPDYSDAPTMARDNPGVDQEAQNLLEGLRNCQRDIAELTAYEARLVALLSSNDKSAGIDEHDLRRAVAFLRKFQDAADARKVRYDLTGVDVEELLAAAKRGAAGRRPVSISGSLLNSALKASVASVTVDNHPPETPAEWLIAHSTCELQAKQADIELTLATLLDAAVLPPLPQSGWEIATYIIESSDSIENAFDLTSRLTALRDRLAFLFPVGLDLHAICNELRTDEAIKALCANLPDGYQAPVSLSVLEELAGTNEQPLFRVLRELRSLLGSERLAQQNIVEIRNSLTAEIGRLRDLGPVLEQVVKDLDAVVAAGAPDWAERLKADPLNAAALTPEDWEASWAWAMMKAKVDRIIALGNGDQHRTAKATALRRRGQLFEELIRTRTLIGLNQRMSNSVKRALHAFTEAVAKIGKGTGKNAPRFRLAAQDAAKKASKAAPVWIMPEYKIPEQIPPNIGDFDLVILDEASQSDITALAALFRGKNLLIVGDEEQVSPSNVAIPTERINALRADCLLGLPNARLIDENASIFEIARRMHPDTHVILREHFRCVAPIIQFSTQFYANRLQPIRVPKASERFDPPLVDVYIKGAKRDGKSNVDEARFIVDEIAEIVGNPKHKDRDIGVISLIGSTQADAIQRMLIEDERVGTDIITERRIICGDARTMQGQERSIIFLSMVAVPGQAHAQTKKTDQQRINVAMSRARDRLYLARSVCLEDLSPVDIKAMVLQHFQDPMPEGRNAVSSGTSDDLFAKCDSGFEREVLRLLLEANYRVRPQVKAGAFSIDLVIEGAEDRRLAVELDGDAYHGPDVWERDMARQAALERAGWTFWRVFGSQWNSQKDYWWQDLKDTLTRMGIEPIGFERLDERFTEFRDIDPCHVDLGYPAKPCAAGAAPEPKPNGFPSANSDVEEIAIQTPALLGSDEDGKHPITRHDNQLSSLDVPASINNSIEFNRIDDEDNGASSMNGIERQRLASDSSLEVEHQPIAGSQDISQQADTLRSVDAETVVDVLPAADPNQFYESTYQDQIIVMAAKLIDSEGPITFKRLSDRIARLHGFQRTGKQITSTIWAACHRLRRYESTPDDNQVFWPKDVDPTPESPFRGLLLNGEKREWREVPHPEKISLIRKTLDDKRADDDLARLVAQKIGFARITTKFRVEISELEKQITNKTTFL